MRCTPGGFFYSFPAIFEVPLYLIIDRTSDSCGTIDFVQSHFIPSAILGRRGNNGTICIDFYILFIHVLNIETGKKKSKIKPLLITSYYRVCYSYRSWNALHKRLIHVINRSRTLENNNLTCLWCSMCVGGFYFLSPQFIEKLSWLEKRGDFNLTLQFS